MEFTEFAVIVVTLLIFLPQILVYALHVVILLRSRGKATVTKLVEKKECSDVSFIMPIKKEPLEYVVDATKYIHSLGIRNYEIIIVSDDDEDYKNKLVNLVHELREQGINIWLVWRSYSRGYRTGALNDGLYISKGEYVYIIDVDTRPSKCFFERAIQILESSPNTIAVVGRWEPLNMDTRLSQALALGLRFLTRVLYRARSMNKLFTYPLGTGTLYKSRILKEYFKGWDEDRVQDDMEIGARIMRSNYKIVYLDDCPIFVENPGTYKSFRVQQARWAYGAMDVALTRFRYIVSSNYPLVVKAEALMYLLQYIPQTLVFTSTLILAGLCFFKPVEPLALGFALTIVLVAMLAAYSYVMYVESNMSNAMWEFMVLAGRLSAVSVAISPYIAINTIKALLRKREVYRRTPKGIYQRLYSNVRFPCELVLGLYFLISGVISIMHGMRILPLWILLTSMGYIYVVIRFPRDVFYK
ncbi:MAG: glycosyltransferase family 2 protein [Desulfurococcaceae archaeon]